MNDEFQLPENAELFFDSNRGVYIPQHFAEWLDKTGSMYSDDVTEKETLGILKSGPEHEHYWEAWIVALDSTWTDTVNGKRYTLYQDGDLWLIPESD